jgi:hypothetical protein
MSEIMLTRDECERQGCEVSFRSTGRVGVVVFLGRADSRWELVKVYCSHRCEALARPTPPWGNRMPKRRVS